MFVVRDRIKFGLWRESFVKLVFLDHPITQLSLSATCSHDTITHNNITHDTITEDNITLDNITLDNITHTHYHTRHYHT